MSLSPSSLSVQTGETAVLEANVNLVNATVKQVKFSSADTNIAQVNPSTVFPPPPYRTYVIGQKVGSTSISAQTLLNPSGSCTAPSSTNVSVEASGWFQTQEGDIHSQGKLSVNIPATATDRNLSVSETNPPGIISHQTSPGEAFFGEGYPSNNQTDHWLAKSEYKGKPFGSWQFFKKKYAMRMTQENFNGTLPASDGVYFSSQNQTLQGNWNLPANRWLVILVEGDIRINQNITVPQTSFLALVAKGNIEFASNVSKAQGMFVSDGRIDTGTGSIQFQGEGIFAASSFALNRDFQDQRNRTTPAEYFKFRPDFLINSYKDKENNLYWFDFTWEEIAP